MSAGALGNIHNAIIAASALPSTVTVVSSSGKLTSHHNLSILRASRAATLCVENRWRCLDALRDVPKLR